MRAKREAYLSVRISPLLKQYLSDIALMENRTISQLAGILIESGFAAKHPKQFGKFVRQTMKCNKSELRRTRNVARFVEVVKR